MRTHPMSSDTRPVGVVGAEHELGGSATDVDDEVGRRRVEVGGRAEERERGLFLTGEELGRDAERVERGGEEVVAVGRVARRARGRGAHAFDAVLVDRAAVLAQHVDRALDRLRRERTGAVDALAEARDAHAPVERAQLRVAARPVDVGDEQTDRVRPDVDRRDPRSPPLPSFWRQQTSYSPGC